MAAGANGEKAASQAYAIVFRNVIAQANTLAYLDTFVFLSVAAAIMFFLSFALKKNQPGARRIVAECQRKVEMSGFLQFRDVRFQGLRHG
jgi:pantothenate kinase type III